MVQNMHVNIVTYVVNYCHNESFAIGDNLAGKPTNEVSGISMNEVNLILYRYNVICWYNVICRYNIIYGGTIVKYYRWRDAKREGVVFFGECWQIREDRQRKKKALGLSDEE